MLYSVGAWRPDAMLFVHIGVLQILRLAIVVIDKIFFEEGTKR